MADSPGNASGLRAVPDREDPDVYGHIEFFDGQTVHNLTIGVYYGGPTENYDEAILLTENGRVIRHPYWSVPRDSTEEERAAVGWTW